MAHLDFNAATVEPNSSFDPIPAGWYNAQVIESEIKPTKSGDGSYLSITLQILGGDFNNRKVFDRFNIDNKNPVAVDIAYKQLSALCHAVGILQVQDSQQLHSKPMQIKVSLRGASTDPQTGAQYDSQNEIKGYKAIEGGIPIAGGAPAWAAQQAPAAFQQPPQPAFQQPQQPAVQQAPALPPWQQQAPAQPAQAQAQAIAAAGSTPPWARPAQ